MLVVGVGIGLVMQVLVLAVQNDAPARNIGVATSTATFFRSMGGSLGVAHLRRDLRVAARRASWPASRAPPGSPAARTSAPTRSTRCRPACATTSCSRSSTALQPVFLVGAAFTAVAFVLALDAARGAAAQDDARADRGARRGRYGWRIADARRLHRRARGAPPQRHPAPPRADPRDAARARAERRRRHARLRALPLPLRVGPRGRRVAVALSSRKNYISLYVLCADERGYLAERYVERLPKASIGKSCVRFKRHERHRPRRRCATCSPTRAASAIPPRLPERSSTG